MSRKISDLLMSILNKNPNTLDISKNNLIECYLVILSI